MEERAMAGPYRRRHLLPAILAVAIFAPAFAGASDTLLAGVLPGGGLMRKPIVSMREARYKNLVTQNTDFSCGAAALATILKYGYGRDVGEDAVLSDMLKIGDREQVRRRGFSLFDIKRYVEALGMEGRGYKLDREQLKSLKVPTIVLLNIKGYQHFVVLNKTRGDKAYLADPALGNKIVSLDDFEANWNGVVFAVIGRGFDEHTVLLSPPEPLSARRLLDVYAMIPDAQLLDFGFIHADRLRF